jgi:Ni2+-binding GTPase involved in maturation of urease and hydrogenase
MNDDLGYPEQRSDGKGPHPKVEDLFITRREFHDYVIDNRDRQDQNKAEILEAIEKVTDKVSEECHEDVSALSGRVKDLENDAKKQTLIAASIAGLVSVVTTAIGAAVVFIRGG